MTSHLPLDETLSHETDPDLGKGKHRAKQSCIPCRTRKVKCDRIKPCQACCVRGLPSQCEYVSSNEDRFLISQADAIEELRSEVSRLKQRLAEVGGGSSQEQSLPSAAHPSPSAATGPTARHGSAGAGFVPYEKYAALESLFRVIASGSPDVVADTVAQVRNGVPLENVAQLARRLIGDDSSGSSHSSSSVPPSTEYPTPSSRGEFDYPEAKRVKREPDHDRDVGQVPNSMSPIHLSFPQPFSIALRSKSPGQTNGALEVHPGPEENGDDEQGVEEVAPEEIGSDETTLSRDQQIARKRGRSPGPAKRNISGRNATMELFLARFVDAFSPKVEGGWGSSTTLRSAAEFRAFSPILRDALEAVSVTYFGQATSDLQLELTAYDTYLSVLRNLQVALYDPEQSKSQAILLTVTVLMAFESIQRTTSGSIVNHGRGALRLIEYRGAHRHMYGIEHMFFAEFRPYLACIALVVREPSFLAKDEWKIVPWSAGSSVKDSLQLLLDVTVDIPALLYEFDKFMQASNDAVLSYADMAATQTVLCNWVAQIDRRLRRWKEEWVDSQPDGPAEEGVLVGDNQFPVFQCRNLDTGVLITPKPLVYSDLRHAQTMCIYYSAHLVLAAADLRPVGGISSREQYIFACNICRSMESYIRTIPGGLINRLAFPLRVAYDALPEGGIERKFVEDVFHLVEEKFKLRLWGSMIPEISTRKSYAIEISN